jgi:hypothetical protein
VSEVHRQAVQATHEVLEQFVMDQGFEGMLGDWIVFGSVVKVDEDGDPDAQYFVAMTGGSLLQHVALGLVEKGKDVLLNGQSL